MDSEPQSGDLQPSCSTGRCGRRPWMVWLGLAVVVVVYAWLDHRSNTVVPAAFTWVEDLEAGLAQAERTNRHVLVKFYATWCPPCRILDREVFTRQDVAESLANWVPVSIDVDKQGAVAARYEISSIPVILALGADGQVLARVHGAVSAEEFIQFVRAHEPKGVTGTKPAN